MTIHIFEIPPTHWACPSCDVTDTTRKAEAHTQFHSCPGLGGLNAPLVVVKRPGDKPDARQVVQRREDDGTIGSIRTDRGDGSNDITVFAPVATTTAESPDTE